MTTTVPSPPAATIVPWSPAHRAGVAALLHAVRARELGLPRTEAIVEDLHDPQRTLRPPGGELWVAEAAGKVVGTIALDLRSAPLGVLRALFVAPPWRGPPARLGDRLLDRLLAHARDRGVRTVLLDSHPSLVRAHRFYARRGFVRVAPDEAPRPFSPRLAGNVVWRIEIQPTARPSEGVG